MKRKEKTINLTFFHFSKCKRKISCQWWCADQINHTCRPKGHIIHPSLAEWTDLLEFSFFLLGRPGIRLVKLKLGNLRRKEKKRRKTESGMDRVKFHCFLQRLPRLYFPFVPLKYTETVDFLESKMQKEEVEDVKEPHD